MDGSARPIDLDLYFEAILRGTDKLPGKGMWIGTDIF
jgi:hypothetical protein